MPTRLLAAEIAAGTALTNSTAETVLGSYTIPAYSMQVGKVYRVRAAVIATATNSTDTLAVNVRLGTVTLTGTVLAAAAATDVADNNVTIIDLVGTVRSISGTGAAACTSSWCGTVTAFGAEGTGTARAAYEIDTTDNAVANFLQITGTWSVASASNSCRLDFLIVEELT